MLQKHQKTPVLLPPLPPALHCTATLHTSVSSLGPPPRAPRCRLVTSRIMNIFCRESQPKPLLATVTGLGVYPTWDHLQPGCLLVLSEDKWLVHPRCIRLMGGLQPVHGPSTFYMMYQRNHRPVMMLNTGTWQLPQSCVVLTKKSPLFGSVQVSIFHGVRPPAPSPCAAMVLMQYQVVRISVKLLNNPQQLSSSKHTSVKVVYHTR